MFFLFFFFIISQPDWKITGVICFSEKLCRCFACICICAALLCCTGIRWCCPHLSHPSLVCCFSSPLLAHSLLLQPKPLVPPCHPSSLFLSLSLRSRLPVLLLALRQPLRHALGKRLKTRMQIIRLYGDQPCC